MRVDSSATRRLLAGLAVAVAGALTSACSTPGVYPSVLSPPTPRDETTLTPDQVKQAMDGLVSDRNHLCAEAVANDPAGSPPPSCAPQNAAAGAPAKP